MAKASNAFYNKVQLSFQMQWIWNNTLAME